MCFEVPQLAFIFVRDYMKNLLVVLLATLSFNAYSYDNSNCAERNIISIAFTAEVFDSKNFDIAGEYKSYTNKLDNIAAKQLGCYVIELVSVAFIFTSNIKVFTIKYFGCKSDRDDVSFCAIAVIVGISIERKCSK